MLGNRKNHTYRVFTRDDKRFDFVIPSTSGDDILFEYSALSLNLSLSLSLSNRIESNRIEDKHEEELCFK